MYTKKVFVVAGLAVLFAVSANANLVSNPDMELGGDPTTLPDDWETWGGASAPVSGTDTATYHSPGQSAFIRKGGGSPWFWQTIAVAPSAEYTVDFWAMGAMPHVHIEAYNGSGWSNLPGAYWSYYFGTYGYYTYETGDPENEWTHMVHHSASLDITSFTTLADTQLIKLILKNGYESETFNTWYDDVRISLVGDVDGDGFVGGRDWNRIISNWGKTGASREDGDLDLDGTVSGPDYTIVMNNWGVGTLPASEPPGAIPEPGTLLFLVAGLLAGTSRRR